MSCRLNTKLIFWKEAHPGGENMALLFHCGFSGFKVILSEYFGFFICTVRLSSSLVAQQ